MAFWFPWMIEKQLSKKLQTLIHDNELQKQFSTGAMDATKDYNASIVIQKWEQTIAKVLSSKK